MSDMSITVIYHGMSQTVLYLHYPLIIFISRSKDY